MLPSFRAVISALIRRSPVLAYETFNNYSFGLCSRFSSQLSFWLRDQGSAFCPNDSFLSLVCRLRSDAQECIAEMSEPRRIPSAIGSDSCGHPACANKSSGRNTARNRRHPTQLAGFLAGVGGLIAPLRNSLLAQAVEIHGLSRLQADINSCTGARSADSVALSRAGKQTAGTTSRSLRPGRRPVDQVFSNSEMLHFVTTWISSRRRKSAAPLPLASASVPRALNLPRLRAKKVSAAFVSLHSRLRSGVALRAFVERRAQRWRLGSIAGHYDCFFLRSRRRRAQRGASQQAHTALPLPLLIRTERGAAAVADRPAAALRSILQAQVAEMGEKKHHQVAVFSSSRSHSTRRAARSAPKRSLSLCYKCYSSRFRVDIHPLLNQIFRQQSYRNQLTGLGYAPLDASLFYKISLPKAWRVSAPLPAGYHPFALSAQGVRRIAPKRRRQPGASISPITEVKYVLSN